MKTRYGSNRRSRVMVAALTSAGVLATMIGPANAQLPDLQLPAVQSTVTGSSTGQPPVSYKGAPTPGPFSPGHLTGYISDISSHGLGSYHAVVDRFSRGQFEYPEIMEQNLATVVAVNNAAADDPELIARAQFDADADQAGVVHAISDALGAELGAHFRIALAEGRLPKTEFLIGNGYLGRAGGIASATYVEKLVFDHARPFEVAPEQINKYQSGGRDYYGTTPSFPSGHTNQATWISTLLAMMLPEVGPQLLARGSEAGYHRVVMGVHYPLDVIGGRMTGTAAAADRWNDPKMRDAIKQAGDEIRAEMRWRTGEDIAGIVAADTPYLDDRAAVEVYTERMTYGFPQIRPADTPVIVPQAAPELLLAQFPELNYHQRAEVLRKTALPAGYPLDDGSERGSWQRLNMAAAWAADVVVQGDGTVLVNGT